MNQILSGITNVGTGVIKALTYSCMYRLNIEKYNRDKNTNGLYYNI